MDAPGLDGDEDATKPALRLYLLGSLRARLGDRDLSLGSSQQQSVLATLALRVNRTVPRHSLIAAIWGPDFPAYAVNIVQKCVSGLRRSLEPDRAPRSPSRVLAWNGAGYQLHVDPGCVDLEVFHSRAGAAGAALKARDFAGASRGYHDALRLWRGPAFDGLTTPLLDAERARLDERRIGVIEERIAADLELGRDTDLVTELRQLIAQYPLRERLRKLLMMALYRCGRQAEALAAFREAHRYLAEEVGVQPAAELREMHRRILADTDTTAPPAREPLEVASDEPAGDLPRPAQTPHAAPGFTGRADQIRRLDELAQVAEGDTTPVAVITGTAGVGKTFLALHWAHRSIGRFPGGQLYADLRGFDAHGDPREVEEVLRGFLEALGVPARRIPVHREQQAALYRSLLAGRRMLVVLDNAHDTDQVTPLLPGGGGCMAVVTSRRRLSGLLAAGAYAVGTPLFTADESRQMLTNRLGLERVTAEPEAVRQVITASAHLPLALAVVGARAAVHPHFSLSTFAEQLRHAHGGLDSFVAEDANSDARKVLSWSYRSLSPGAARLFRLLGLHPGPDLTAPAATCLADSTAASVRELLIELCVAHLIEERIPGRFAFHDLLRAYAAEQAGKSNAEIQPATVRMLDYYRHTVRAADQALYPYRGDPQLAVPDPAPATAAAPMTRWEATTWFNDEHANLLAVVTMAARSGHHGHVYDIAWSMSAFLNYQGHWHDWVTTMDAALRAARRLGDRLGQAHAHRLMNLACIQLGRLDVADRHARTALRLFGELGDPAGSARIHLNLSRVLERQGRVSQALDEARQALKLFRLGADRAGEADALSWVGWYCGHLGRPAQALDYCLQSLAVHRSNAGWPGQADTWAGLGYAHHQLGHHAEAVDCHRRALSLWRELGDRYEIAATLARLGDSHRGAGDHGSTRQAWSQAAEIFEELGHPDAERLRRLLIIEH